MALDPSKAPEFLDSMMKRNKIVIISATYCQFCSKLKVLFIELKQRFVSLEIDIIPNGREVFAEVVGRTNVHTVPQIFVRGKFVGGYDEIIGIYKTGKLEHLLDGM